MMFKSWTNENSSRLPFKAVPILLWVTQFKKLYSQAVFASIKMVPGGLSIINDEKMPSLKYTLREYDLDFLSRIARSWDVEISQKDKSSALTDLLGCMLDEQRFLEKIKLLPETARAALEELQENGGVIALDVFTRKHGEIRTFGAAKREREEPDLHPVSTSEVLWYAGLIGKGFLQREGEVREAVYLPEEFLTISQKHIHAPMRIAPRPAVDQTPRHIRPASSQILDHLTDLLAAQRMGRRLDPQVFQQWKIPELFLTGVLQTGGIIDAKEQPVQEQVKEFLQLSRKSALFEVVNVWIGSGKINDLRMIPGLVFEGNWKNDPQIPRRFLLEILNPLSQGTWYSLSSLVEQVREKQPDFQRFGGDYNSWFIRKEGTDEFLGGFENWNEVEGALLRYLVTGPLHWLGIVDLALTRPDGQVTAFRLTAPGACVLAGTGIPTDFLENEEIEFKQSNILGLHENAPCSLRYQVGRFARLARISGRTSWYQITPETLKTASEQGLSLRQLMQLLEKGQKKPLPLAFRTLVDRWEKHGLEAELRTGLLLKFSTPETCSLFNKHPRSAPMILEQLNPVTLLLQPNSGDAVQRLLAELGILAETEAVV
jgi:hypothetical protein